MDISVFGLGKLGACTAACFASKGFNVLGVDINKQAVDKINRSEAPVEEPQLQELIDQSKGRLRATQDIAEAVANSDISFLIVPTPSKADGHFSGEYLCAVLKSMGEALKSKNSFHTIVVTSTVSPGTIEKTLIPLIEETSGKVLNRDFGFAYNPEFIALGTVIQDFLYPDMVLIGESSDRVGELLEAIYKQTCLSTPYIARMSLVSAEIAKISLNSYVTMKISFANTLGNICGAMPGANVDDVTKALGADKRISPHYLKGGLGFGGPCFPRDNRAFSAFAADHGIDAKLAKATDEVNLFQNERLARSIAQLCQQKGIQQVAILGLSYKPNTPVIEESPAIRLIEKLVQANIKVVAYDPLLNARDDTQKIFGAAVSLVDSMAECFNQTSMCILMTNDPAWSAINLSTIVHVPTVIIDCWRILAGSALVKHECIEYLQLGEFTKRAALLL